MTKQVTIAFSIGKYEDEVLCDVVPMQACHILLGCPWQYDIGLLIIMGILIDIFL